MTKPIKYHIGFVIYPKMTQLDFTAPHQVFAFLPETKIHLLWKERQAIETDEGLTLFPTTSFAECPPLDVICIPGGPGQVEMMQDAEVLAFLQTQSETVSYLTSVCTGSLILAAAGLLSGYRATCHWAFLDQLAAFGVNVSSERVVVDRNRITGGGVTAGMDFGLKVASVLYGEETAKLIQLMLQYDPCPPFDVGSPEKAGEELVQQVRTFGKELIDASWEQTLKITIKPPTLAVIQ